MNKPLNQKLLKSLKRLLERYRADLLRRDENNAAGMVSVIIKFVEEDIP